MKKLMNCFSKLNSWAVMVFACGLVACSGEKYHVEGTITEAEDSVLYLEHIGITETTVLDSVRLKADGAFAFSLKAAAAPEFYRLRIARQVINLAADSTETVTVRASYPTMGSQYEVEGSEDCSKIRELSLELMRLQSAVNAIVRDPKLNVAAVNDSVARVVDAYKERVKKEYIFPEPMRAYAYFALFQTVSVGQGGGFFLFNPRSSNDDVKVFAAVATSWDTYYPEAERGRNLHNIAIEGMRDQRIIRNRQLSQEMALDNVDVSNILDITLPDSKGQEHRLSDLGGKVVLLDFCVYSTEGTTERIMAMRDLYNKYHARGLEIYQIGFDGDEHFWKTQTAALPWICVYDEAGGGSLNLLRYNVGVLPTYFLLNRDTSVHKRDVQIEDIDREISRLLN